MTGPQRTPQTVTPEGAPVRPLPEGVMLRDATTQVDERRVLRELAIVYARDRRTGYEPSPVALRRALHSLAYEQAARLGFDREPLVNIARWWYQRQRAIKRRQRGLPPEQSGAR